MMHDKTTWKFPLPRTHTGMLQGNGRMGTMIWGAGATLRITVGRADFWDHRGGMSFTESHSFSNIRSILERKDKDAMTSLFETGSFKKAGLPRNPSVLPVGRVDFDLGQGAELLTGKLCFSDGSVEVCYRKSDAAHTMKLELSMAKDVLSVCFDKNDDVPGIRHMSSWQYVGEYLRSIAFEPPIEFSEGNGTCGFVQNCPSDHSLCLALGLNDRRCAIASARGEDCAAAKSAAVNIAADTLGDGWKSMRRQSKSWWRQYWRDVPSVDVPDETIQFLYQYNMYKFAGLSHPDGVPCGLQGPWIEEYRMPPWSADYHFNINAQMNYWPAFKGNRLEHLKPLFNMIWSWRDRLQHIAKMFVGVEDGYLLPHSVDDQGTCMGRYWSGNVDPSCAGWIAQMMFDYVRHSGDKEFLVDVAFPFMKGAMRVYEKLLEKEGDCYRMPVGVSAEWNANYVDPASWGKNASFQLACVHRLCEDLLEAGKMIGEELNPTWVEIHKKLPQAAVMDDYGRNVIGIWDGQKLDHTHRHHSHLAAIYPFDTIDIEAEGWRDIVNYSICHWVAKGMGGWAGWSMPWASILHSRMGNGDTAELLLQIWSRIFTNKGHGTLHDARIPGIAGSIFADSAKYSAKGPRPESEIMQIESGMGAATAVMEMLAHSRRGVLRIFPAVPEKWRDIVFDGILCEGGFLVGAERKNGIVQQCSISAKKDCSLKIANPWGARTVLYVTSRKDGILSGEILALDLQKGESARFVEHNKEHK